MGKTTWGNSEKLLGVIVDLFRDVSVQLPVMTDKFCLSHSHYSSLFGMILCLLSLIVRVLNRALKTGIALLNVVNLQNQ